MVRNLTLLILLLAYCTHTSAQSDTSEGKNTTDTLLIINKELAHKIEEEYRNKHDLNADLMPDYSKEWMVTDRPHVAETPFLVPKSYLQIETGFQIQESKTDLYKTNDITYNTTLIRLGLSRRIEARLEMEYAGYTTKRKTDDSLTANEKGLSGLNVGSKVFLFNGHGIVPKGTLLYSVSLPFIGSKSFRPSYTAASLKFLFLNRITKFYEFEYNLGFQWSGNTKNTAYSYALNNEFQLSHKLHFFMELYGYFIENSGDDDSFNGSFANDHRINGGFWYLINKGLQLDLSGGVGLSKISPDYYFAVGLSNRLNLKFNHKAK